MMTMGNVTNEEVRAKIQQEIGPHEDLRKETQTAVVAFFPLARIWGECSTNHSPPALFFSFFFVFSFLKRRLACAH